MTEHGCPSRTTSRCNRHSPPLPKPATAADPLRQAVEALVNPPIDPGMRNTTPLHYIADAERVGGRSEWAMRFAECAALLRHAYKREDRLIAELRRVLDGNAQGGES